MENTKVILASRPDGEATPDCFEVVTETLGELPEDRVRVAVEYISVDAGTRTMLRGEGFHMQVGLGETMTPVDILEGILRVTVLVAISRPAEFIEITFQQQMQKS